MYRFLGKKEPLKIYKTQSKSLQKISAVASHLPKLLLTNQVQKTIDALNKNESQKAEIERFYKKESNKNKLSDDLLDQKIIDMLKENL